MFFVNSRSINGIFIEISSKFNQKNTLNSTLDEFQLLKNHLRGQNFDSSFKIMTIISNFQQWIYSLFLITNKLCHHPQNILLIKRHSLAAVLNYLKDKKFNDDEKNNTFANIRNLCFTNIVLRCLSIRQYEYAYLIIDTLEMNHLLKLLSAHCKLTKFLGVNYLACSKLEIANENEDILVGKVDVDEVPSLAAQFGISSIPTLVVLKQGKVTAKKVGYCAKQQVLDLLEQ
jgi:hypothetical protein